MTWRVRKYVRLDDGVHNNIVDPGPLPVLRASGDTWSGDRVCFWEVMAFPMFMVMGHLRSKIVVGKIMRSVGIIGKNREGGREGVGKWGANPLHPRPAAVKPPAFSPQARTRGRVNDDPTRVLPDT